MWRKRRSFVLHRCKVILKEINLFRFYFIIKVFEANFAVLIYGTKEFSIQHNLFYNSIYRMMYINTTHCCSQCILMLSIQGISWLDKNVNQLFRKWETREQYEETQQWYRKCDVLWQESNLSIRG